MHLWHSWVTKYGWDSIAVYQECKCGKRRYIQFASNVPVLPVNTGWLQQGDHSMDAEEVNAPQSPHDPFLVMR